MFWNNVWKQSFLTDFIMCEILPSLDPNATIESEKMWKRIQHLDLILIKKADLWIHQRLSPKATKMSQPCSKQFKTSCNDNGLISRYPPWPRQWPILNRMYFWSTTFIPVLNGAKLAKHLTNSNMSKTIST